MGNHYHLLVETPLGNLGHGMRHLNGVYTQFFNRDQRRDGALFRGRYKAIVVDADEYLLHLTSYIHRNPIEARMVERLSDYRWSSYPAYIGRTAAPAWLRRAMVYSMLGGKARRYQSFVESGVDEDLAQFYRGGTIPPILGGERFKEEVLDRHGHEDPEITELRRVHEPASIEKIIAVVASALECNQETIFESVRGRQNLARMLVAHFAHVAGQLTYRENRRSPWNESLQRRGIQYSETGTFASGKQAIKQLGASTPAANDAKPDLTPAPSRPRRLP